MTSLDDRFDKRFPLGVSTDIDLDVTDEVKSFIHEELARRDREWMKRVEKLWDLLDSIDSLPDMLHPRDAKGHEKCWRMMVKRAEERHKILKSDGYNLSTLLEDKQ